MKLKLHVMKKLIILLILACFYGCKTDTNKNKAEVNNTKKEIINEFIVQVLYKVNVEDEFKFSLTHITVDEFQKKHIHILEKVSKTTSFDKIVANFGDNFSTRFNIDLGTKIVKEVEIKSIKLTYGTKELFITPDELDEYFVINGYIDFDSTNRTLTTKKMDNKHYPTLTLNRKAYNILKKEIK